MSAARVGGLTGAQRRVFSVARLAAVEATPYFASALFAMIPVAAPGLGTFAVDRFWRVYLDPELLVEGGRWAVPELGAVLVHEVSHLLREHAARAESCAAPVDRMRWNFAADAEINDDLLAAGLALPEGVITPAALGLAEGGTAEAYYAALPASPPTDDGGAQASGTGTGDGDGEGGGCGSGSGDAPSGVELPQSVRVDGRAGLSGEAATAVRVRTAADVASAAGRGSVPAGVARWAAETLSAPQVPWQRVLAATVRRVVAHQAGMSLRSYRRPSRHQVPGVVLPSLRAPKITVDVVVDTSGSMSAADLSAALGEIRGVLAAGMVSQTRVSCCDAASSTPRRVSTVDQVALVGGGGTDMRVGIAATLATHPRPSVVIVCTDGDTPWPDTRLPVPLIVVLIGAHPGAVAAVPSWARTVQVDPSGTVAA